MLAMMIFLFGVLGVMGMQYYAIGGNISSRDLRNGSTVSWSGVETLKASAVGATGATGTAQANIDLDPLRPGATLATRRRWVVNDCMELTLNRDDQTCGDLVAVCVTDPDGGVRTSPIQAIRVRTCWNDRRGANHSVTFDTVEAR